MNNTALEIKDIFGLADDRAERAVDPLRKIAKRANAESIGDRVEVQVEKTVLREMKDVATKADMEKLSSKMDSQFIWVVGILIATLVSLVATLVTLYPRAERLAPQTTEIPR